MYLNELLGVVDLIDVDINFIENDKNNIDSYFIIFHSENYIVKKIKPINEYHLIVEIEKR